MIFSTLTIEGRHSYQLLSGGVTPRAIAWISTYSKEVGDNLAPFSFFTVASCNPPVLLYTQINQSNGFDKDTLKNLLETGECVVNIVDSALLEKMNMTSADIPSNESEFSFADVESSPSHHVRALSVKESPVRYECTLRDVIPISELPAGGKIILLDVRYIYVRDDLLTEGKIDQSLFSTIGKLGGDYYSDSSNKVRISRPD